MNYPKSFTAACNSMVHTLTLTFGLPYDLFRASYATAVKWGLIKDSLLGSAKFERDICKIEKLTLGPWARRV